MDYKDISPELREKAKGLSGDELLKLAKDEGVELTDELLEQVAGGASGIWGGGNECPHCSVELKYVADDTLECPNCGRQFTA